ncbi:MAG: hypothetical protein ACOC1K_07885 [Nanoarchaeota archaeon]
MDDLIQTAKQKKPDKWFEIFDLTVKTSDEKKQKQLRKIAYNKFSKMLNNEIERS